MQAVSINKTRLTLALTAVLLSLPHSALADSIDITSSAVPTTVLAPSSDSFSLNDGAGTFDSSLGAFVFQTGDFTIGNSGIPDQVIPFSFEDTITLNGITQVLTFSGQDAVTDAADVLTISADTAVLFGDEIFTVQPFSLTADAMGDLPIDLEATVTPTPEPGSLLLLGTGMFGGAVLALRKRSLQRA